MTTPHSQADASVELHMRQAWLAEPEPDLQPAVVRVGWSHDALLVRAVLTDMDIFNPVQEFNQVAYTQGDVFEIFLRPADQEVYFEIHVSPHNQVLQLRWPDAEAIRSPRKGRDEEEILGPYKLWQPRITSQTHIDEAAHQWTVDAVVPFVLVAESRPVKTGSIWYCSFCRYDYTRGRTKPVYSSTSDHARADFHRQQEWRPLTVQP